MAAPPPMIFPGLPGRDKERRCHRNTMRLVTGSANCTRTLGFHEVNHTGWPLLYGSFRLLLLYGSFCVRVLRASHPCTLLAIESTSLANESTSLAITPPTSTYSELHCYRRPAGERAGLGGRANKQVRHRCELVAISQGNYDLLSC